MGLWRAPGDITAPTGEPGAWCCVLSPGLATVGAGLGQLRDTQQRLVSGRTERGVTTRGTTTVSISAESKLCHTLTNSARRLSQPLSGHDCEWWPKILRHVRRKKERQKAHLQSWNLPPRSAAASSSASTDLSMSDVEYTFIVLFHLWILGNFRGSMSTPSSANRTSRSSLVGESLESESIGTS